MMPRLHTAATSAAFLLTGVGTALLGATLPAMLHEGRFSDALGGTLLLAGWGGSTAGALLVYGEERRCAAVGLLLSAVALLLLSSAHPPLPVVLYLVFGLGLGLTMTAVSLWRSRRVSPAEAELALNRLNLIWATGACLAPPLALRSLSLLSVHSLFRLAALAFLVVALVLLADALRRVSAAPERRPGRTVQPWAPLRFGLFAAACVGLESAIGSWLTTYTQRTGSGVGVAVSANLAFWLGLLLSRAAHSLVSLPGLHTTQARRWHLIATALGTALLFHPAAGTLVAAGLLCGVGLGPLYPYVLAVTLPRYRSGAVFVLAGVGASVVPWYTGTLSTALGSLRGGLLVPLLTLVPLCGTAYLLEKDALPARQRSTP